jgi:ribosomal protein L33
MAKKGARIRIKIVSKSGFFYVTEKNKMTTTEKLRLTKYDPNIRKRAEFVEGGKFK